MKNIYFITIFVFGSLITLKAQTENKGNFELGSSTSSGISYDFKENNLNLDISPTIGYYLTDHFVVGIGMDVNYRQHNKFHDLNYDFGLFTKYYFKNYNRFQPYVKAQVNKMFWSFPDAISYNWAYSLSERNYSWSVGGGLSYWIKPSVALTSEINYCHTYRKSYPEYDFDNLGLKFGILVKLKGKK